MSGAFCCVVRRCVLLCCAQVCCVCAGVTVTVSHVCLSNRNMSKRYSIMAFNAGDKVNCSTWTQVRNVNLVLLSRAVVKIYSYFQK